MRLMISAVVVVYIGYFFPSYILLDYYLSITREWILNPSLDRVLYSAIAYYLLPVSAFFALFVGARRDKHWKQYSTSWPRNTCTWGEGVLVLLGLISLNSVSNYIQYIVFDWFSPGSWQAQAYNFTPLFSAYDGVIDWSSVLRSAMDGVFISPVIEELIFRYLLFVIFRSVLGVTGAALLSSLIFASIHQWELYAFMSGVFLCWAFERYRRLEVVIAIHAGHNLFILLYDLVYYSITQLHFNPWEVVDINIVALQSGYLVLFLLFIDYQRREFRKE
ncbi:CPBP family intramembrane metalloprotease [Vibrio crassostreae]|jgi:membrane protease YdiL (CAAX protease family)|uniref:CPBP family intramembrane metalloprotease n=2 Tax=Vibrio TaxID=662 RepID=A0A9X3CRL9_9VIBR|nr:CPBP family intramembrane glutamic endopeptidase [Vibrio qingdaonensis]MCW8348183.1 CPBP family intramembrane metalloprotease [Vibrio qingdaonensis]CAK2481846.1 CPBP family intramembrane metalloprotease [Vibrio crassostreae]CAK2801106.1 CPBP family intramembrane metalloprotease [Vibrio crassostreae]CAK3417204.1 CPBP family intramembrane metalloprotease [Vibrio crassostreae]